MQKKKRSKLTKFGFEFFTVFIGVFAAFALNNWSGNQRDHNAETKILLEISNGLEQDIADMNLNMVGHERGLLSVNYFSDIIRRKRVQDDSLSQRYLDLLRAFTSVQNTSGYETLKSKGLEIVGNDSLRSEIIALYENDYNTLRKLEEEYGELQFFRNYNDDFKRLIVPWFVFDERQRITGIRQPVTLTARDANILLADLWRIRFNRTFILQYYGNVRGKVIRLQKNIDKELHLR